ncbi:hypothetical protein IAT38_000893 [Cryptococcus sp. DSM 104549]
MSRRSTPGPTAYPALPSFQMPPSPTSSKHRTPSIPHIRPPPVPPIPDYHRRFSSKSGTPSVAGTSTGTITGSTIGRRRRKERAHAGTNGVEKEDWADVEPDEVFRRLPVNEVKRVEAKMRSDALNKQSELRAMVGTRYRDLLTSATQITTLHSSSLRLSEELKEISRSCIDPSDFNLVTDGDGNASEASEGEDVVHMLPVAAHMKLLLDAPEALYSYLAHHAYLNSAFLWLITRVVKEGLSSMPDDANGAYLPLLQKQWETLLPFRNQIVQRASNAIRSRDKVDPKSTSETLVSIILLDNLPLVDALALLLSQRSKAVRDILHLSEHTSKASSSPSASTSRRRSNSRIQAANATREAVHERESIAHVLTAAVQCLLETVVAARAIFEKRRQTSLEGESLIEEMLRLVQKGEGAPSGPHTTPVKQTSHQRRASRLVSISLPIPKPSPGANRPPVSAPQILQELPSSQILLRHLPTSITGFTPFITRSPPPALNEKLKAWQAASIELLREAVPSWLAGLKSVADIWEVRSAMEKLLGEGEFEGLIKEALEGEWEKRAREVWDERLEDVVREVETLARDGGEELRADSQNKADLNPDSFLFSELSFPSAPAASFSASSHNTAFTSFLTSAKKRTSLRTPTLDRILLALESSAASIRSDMRGLPASLQAAYQDKVKGALERVVKALEKVLESMGPGRGDSLKGIEAEMLVGRVALYLGKASSFLDDIAGEEDVDREAVEKSLLAVHAKSTLQWKSRAVQEALVLLAPLFDPFRGPAEIRSAWQGPFPTSPSHPVMLSLQSLVSSSKTLGIPPGVDVPIMGDLVQAFVAESRKLEGWKSVGKLGEGEGAAQVAVDQGFFSLLAGEKIEDVGIVQEMLQKVPTSMAPFPSELPTIIDQSLRRSQLLLYPLVAHLARSTPTPSQTPALGHGHALDSRNAALLKFGAPSIGKSGAGTEFRSPVPVAKPGKRMGLLSIAA